MGGWKGQRGVVSRKEISLCECRNNTDYGWCDEEARVVSTARDWGWPGLNCSVERTGDAIDEVYKVNNMVLPAIENEALLNSMPDAIFMVDEKGEMVWLNHAVRTLLGYDPEDIVGRHIEMLVPESARRAHPGYVSQFGKAPVRTQMSSRPVLYAVDKTGMEVPVSISLGSMEYAGKKYFIAILRDASSVQQRIGEVLRQAERDPLTGIGNRFHFVRKLDAAREIGRFALLYLDLANFKPFNDLFGHAVGDEVLKIVARRIQSTIRASDVSARIGGDEFAILFGALSDPVQLEARAHTVAKAIRAPLKVGEIKGEVTAHIGGAMFPDDADTAERVLACADRAMYQAKKTGGTYCHLSCLGTTRRPNA